MATLNWIGKQAVVNHDKEVPFRLLKKIKSASVGNSQNLIVHGDNLEALKALMPHYIGKIKCIYIDPPYNTGNEGWVYNDKVNSPKIREWLKNLKEVTEDDLTRHDKWLCMMYPRLKLLRDLLAIDGTIFISIDDNEQHRLRVLLDEIFDVKNFYGTLTWVNRTKPTNMGEARFNIQQNTEYIFVYGKVSAAKHPRFNLFEGSAREYPYSDEKGNYRLEEIVQRRNLGVLRRDTMLFPVLGIRPKEGYRWQLSSARYTELIKNKKIRLEKGRPYEMIYDFEEASTAYKPFWSHLNGVGTAENGKAELRTLLGINHGFETVKPMPLIKELIFHSTGANDLILDSFAGSATTGHAVLDLNNEDGGNRKFILVEMEDAVAKDITAERVKRAIQKYDYKDGFEFCELDKALFDENGQIEESCDFKQFATYLYFTETQTNIDPAKIDGSYIGESNGTEYYLIFKGINKNTLNKSFLKKIKKDEARKIIYADRCTLDEDLLAEYNIVFKQIPYEVIVY